MVGRTGRKPQPASRGVRSGLVREPSREDKQLAAPLIPDHSQVCPGLPAFQANQVRKAGLPIERLARDARNGSRFPRELVGFDGYVTAFATRKLPQLHEQDAAGLRKRRMTKAFGIEEKRAGGPVPVLVGEYALEHQDLLSVGMVVRGEPRAGLVAHDGSNLARFRTSHQMHALTPYRR